MKKLKNLLNISPFKLSLVIVLTFIGASLVYDADPDSSLIISALDQKSLDLKFKSRGETPIKSKIVILAGDEKSFQAFGQWPWDRGAVFAPMLEKLCSYKPKTVGLDIVWSEYEKKVSEKIKAKLQSHIAGGKSIDEILLETSGDKTLRKAIERCGKKIVLGYALNIAEDGGLAPEDYLQRLQILTEKGSNALSTIQKGNIIFPEHAGDPDANIDFIYSARTGLLNIPDITPPGVAQGFFNNDADSDGNFRKAFLFYRTVAGFVSGLPLRMAQKAISPDDSPPTLFMQPEQPEKGLTQELKIELNTGSVKHTFPIDLNGKAIINYRGPNFAFPNASMADVLSNEDTIEFTQFIPGVGIKTLKQHKTDFFKDAHVLLGITATALYDIRPRPFDGQASGVENHASILDNILNNDFLFRPTTELLLVLNSALLVLGLLYGYVIAKTDAKLGLVIGGLSVTGILIFDQKYLFDKGIVFSGHLQAIQFLFQYIAITVLKYMREESEKKFIRSAFDKYVSPAVINEMLGDPTKLKLGGDKKPISILFSDIRGFTTLSEKLDVKSLTGFLNEYLGAMTDILQANKGTLDKYIGDAVMCFWGAPIEVENQTNFAVKTAVEMILKVGELNKVFKEKYQGLEIDIGVGINTGEVSVGNFGSAKVFEYTVIGDHVNLASRLESLSKYYGARIIISEYTLATLKPDPSFLMREIDTVKVKGKKKPVKIYEIFPNNAVYRSLKDNLETYNQALTDYYAKKWEKAVLGFEKIITARSEEKVSSGLLDRIKYFKTNPPDADWDGSWEMQSK